MLKLGKATVEAIEAILNNRGEATVKREKDNGVVVDSTRKLKSKEPVAEN